MYNKVFLIGNLTRDPELRYTPSGIPVVRFAVAVNRIGRKDAEGNRSQEVDFINVVAWRRLAEICGEFLKKGRSVAVEGRLQIRTFTGRDGQQRTVTEVVADNMQMLGRKPNFTAPTDVGTLGKLGFTEVSSDNPDRIFADAEADSAEDLELAEAVEDQADAGEEVPF